MARQGKGGEAEVKIIVKRGDLEQIQSLLELGQIDEALGILAEILGENQGGG